MRASELLASIVVDDVGRSLGPIRDVRVDPREHRIAGVVIGGGALAPIAHAWGYAEGRAHGPALLRALLSPAARRARFVPAQRIVDWGPARVRISGDPSDLPRLADELAK